MFVGFLDGFDTYSKTSAVGVIVCLCDRYSVLTLIASDGSGGG